MNTMAVRVYSRCFLLVLCAFVCVSELLFSSGFGVSGLGGLGLCGSFRKLGVPYLGVLVIRILLRRVLY